MKAWSTSVITALVALAAVFAPQAQAFITAHPAVAAVIAGIGTIIAHFIPAPNQK